MTLMRRRIILIISILAFLVAVPLVLLYTSGYRLDSGFRLIKTGGLYVSSPVSGSQIFINNELKKETNILQSGLFLQNLKPGKYSVLIAKEGYWPWLKELEVKEQFVTEARALILPKETKGEVIKSSEHQEIVSLINEIKALSATTTEIIRLANHNRQKLWWLPEENKVWVEWIDSASSRPYYLNEDKNLILDSISPVRNADFFPGRRDVIIIAVQNGVFALEIDGKGGRILQPIYKGKEPFFTIYKNESSIYILDEKTLIKINL